MKEPGAHQQGRLGSDVLAALDTALAPVDADLARRYPGDRSGRQPVHTVYVPADRYHDGLVEEWGAAALQLFAEHCPDDVVLGDWLGVDSDVAAAVRRRTVAKLDREPIEDLRIDFEDGYGHRSEDAEDADALAAGRCLGRAVTSGAAPPYTGMRIKGMEAATRRRGLRTLDVFFDSLRSGALPSGWLPDGFVVTLPKVSVVEQVDAMVSVCEALEAAYGLPEGSLRFEIQVETPQAVVGADGTATVAHMLHRARGRCVGLHYGTYDYSAACGVAAAYQSMEHPVADHAKAVLQVAAAGTGVRVSDGSTNVLPVGDADAVHAGWQLHARLVRRSLERGFYQGWDLHPAQLPTRYAATYAFYRQHLAAAAARLRAYAAATGGGVLDEPATAAALAGFLLRALDCGAVDTAEVERYADLDRAGLETFLPQRRAL
ncbi:aldolase/citrate lyase family protein [soil metagenome]